jgi:hypothetical protein
VFFEKEMKGHGFAAVMTVKMGLSFIGENPSSFLRGILFAIATQGTGKIESLRLPR